MVFQNIFLPFIGIGGLLTEIQPVLVVFSLSQKRYKYAELTKMKQLSRIDVTGAENRNYAPVDILSLYILIKSTKNTRT